MAGLPRKRRTDECGAALIIVLLLLLILTTLALAGASTATSELVMAGNEQYLEHACDAASAGVEEAIVGISSGAASTSAGPVSFGDSGTDTYIATVQYLGEAEGPAGSSIAKFAGKHYLIESTGHSLRGAIDTQTQGAMVVSSADGVSRYTRIGNGLSGGSGP